MSEDGAMRSFQCSTAASLSSVMNARARLRKVSAEPLEGVPSSYSLGFNYQLRKNCTHDNITNVVNNRSNNKRTSEAKSVSYTWTRWESYYGVAQSLMKER